MINSYKQLTWRYLKANKKRTILSIIGIILSVALVSSIGLFVNGMQAAQLERAKERYGSYDIMFVHPDDALTSRIINNPGVLRYGFFNMGQAIKLDQDIVFNELAATDSALELLPAYIKQGRLPEKQNEAAVEEWALKYIDKDVKIGGKITINNKEYTLTGILENGIDGQSNNNIILITKDNNISKTNSTLLVEINPGANIRSTVGQLKQLAEGSNAKTSENSTLLMLKGAGDGSPMSSGLLTILAVIVGIVIIATIAVIYNAFQISVVERIKQFGLLRAVGTTPKQIRRIVLREATLLMIIGVPIGLLFGILAVMGISIVFNAIGRDMALNTKLVVDPAILGIGGAVGIASIYVSAFIPSLFAGRISPLAAISTRIAVAKEDIKRRKNRIAQRLFGFEGAMAVKNTRRNRKRYRVTAFSIIISVTLFVTFKSFMDMSFTVSDTPNESGNIHFSILPVGQYDRKMDDTLVNDIMNINEADKVYKTYSTYCINSAIDKGCEVKEIESMGNIYKSVALNGSLKTALPVYIAIYDSGSLEAAKKYLVSGKVDIDGLNSENGVILINRNTIIDYNTRKKYVGPVANIKVGDEISLQSVKPDSYENDILDFGEGVVKKVKVLGIVSNAPFDFYGSEEGLKIITTKGVAEKLTGKDNIEFSRLDIKLKNINDEDDARQKIEAVIASNPSLRLIDNIDSNRRSNSTKLMIEILIYGFVVVVSLIGCINIVNTLTTNIILRKREFAALKSIGLTQRGLKKMIVLEGLLYGFIGSIYGSIIGCALAYVMYEGFGGFSEFEWKAPWDAMVIAAVAALIIGYISVLSPLSRIKKENLIDAIREE